MSKVLIVGPDSSTIKLYQAAIAFQGLETISASSASETLEMIKHNPKLILLDISTPDLKEVNLVDEIKSRIDGRIPLIIIADMKHNHDVSQHSIEGVCEYLSKSETSVGDVIKKVREVIDEKK